MIFLLLFLIVTSLFIMIPRRRVSLVLTGIFLAITVISSSILSLDALLPGLLHGGNLSILINEHVSPFIVCDDLSAFFILIINFTVITGFIYSTGYLKFYFINKPSSWIRLHYLALLWLHASMVMVPLLKNGFYFLIVWEIMTLSSFLLVIFDYEVKGTLRAGITYVIQMHVGMICLLAAFIFSSTRSSGFTFDNLSVYFSSNPNWPVFLLFFIGFGLKAGFFLLHTWLPDAHPAAPSHVSGIMSGVMIKIGIYGILRVTTYLQADFSTIGASVIILSAVTGLFGVMMAILQHDIKKLLAYHSIENIGIIGMGIGLGIYGTSMGNTMISAAGYAGALLHTLNHSLFKSLLFYGAGSVIVRTHTVNIEKMGGLFRFMPITAWAFLVGALAISGLPPFNGFISEFLIFTSLFNGIGNSGFYPLMILFVSMISLVLIGGMALLCFTKVFSVMFLGNPRSSYPEKPEEVGKSMLLAKVLPVIFIVLIGFLPILIISPLMTLTASIFPAVSSLRSDALNEPMGYISVGAFSFLVLVFAIILIRKALLRNRLMESGPTWACGYPATSASQQYTATSFIQEYATLSRPVIKNGYSKINFKDEEIFPGKRDFHTHSDDFIRSKLIFRTANAIINLLRRAAVFQTGKLQHYVLYALLFLILVFLLTFLNLV
jgi:hydrogenase-4 component B